MTQEPGGWELRRALTASDAAMREGFAQLNSRLDKLVSTEAHAADMRRVDDALTRLAGDLAEEREERLAGDHAQSQALEKAFATTSLWVRWIAASLIIPVALFIATILLAQRGGA